MVSNYDLRLGRETLEVLDRLMAQIEQFPADLEKLDLSIVNARYKYIVELKATLDEISADITAKKAAFDEMGDKFNADYAKFKDDKAVADAAFIKNGELHIDTERLHGLVNVMYIKILDYLERTLKARNEAEAFALDAKLSEFDREKVEAAVREFEDLKAEVEQQINEYAAQMDSRYEQWDSKWAEFDGLADLVAELKKTIGTSLINDEIISKQSVYSSQKTALLINTQSELIATQKVSLEGKITEAKSEANAAVLVAKGELTTAINTAKSEAIADAANKVNEAKTELNAAIEALKGEASTDAANKINEAKTEIELNINTAKLEAIGSANAAITAAEQAMARKLGIYEAVTNLGAVSGDVSLDLTTAYTFTAELTGNATVKAGTPKNGITVLLSLAGGDANVVVWDTGILWADGTAPELTAKDMITLTGLNDVWYGVHVASDLAVVA